MTALRNRALKEMIPMNMTYSSTVLHYQPKVDIRSGCIAGMEVMDYPQHTNKKQPPTQHPVEQGVGIMPHTGKQALQQACAQAAYWITNGHNHLIMSINLSDGQQDHTCLAKQIAAVLQEKKLPPEHLEIGIPETMLTTDTDRATRTLNQLADLGILIGINNFGCGGSSISLLRRLPIRSLMIDPIFISGLGYNPNDDAIVSAIIAMANHLDLTTVAKGVETKEQVQFLRREGCDQLQGYFHSRPLPADKFTEMLGLYQKIDRTNGMASRICCRR